jgi:rubrerythrin
MRDMTKTNLEAAFAGESMAAMKYGLYADKALAEGFPEAARLFRAIAWAERVHAANHLKALGKLNSTAENLGAAIDGETHEVDEMYPAFFVVAELQDEAQAKRSFHYALEAEKIHAEMFHTARQKVGEGQDIPEAIVRVCPVCGHTVIGEAPDCCPVCNVKREKYIAF